MKRSNRLVRWAWASAAVCGFLAGSAGAQVRPAAAPATTKQALPNVAASKVIAVVNGDNIVWGQLRPLLEQAGGIPPELTEMQRRELYREALGTLIDDLLVSQYVKKYVPPAPKAEVDKMMAELVAGLKAQKKTLADLCKESLQTEADIRNDMASYIQWNVYFEKHVKEADLKKYYDGYKEFFDGITVRVSHIFIRSSPTTSEGDKTAIRSRLRQLRNEILAGRVDFAQAAKQHSQCPSGAGGGDIGNIPRKYVVEESLARAAFGMKPGELSDVIETSVGMHLVKVTERKPGKGSEYEKIKTEVRGFYMDDLKVGILTQMRKDAKIEIQLP